MKNSVLIPSCLALLLPLAREDSRPLDAAVARDGALYRVDADGERSLVLTVERAGEASRRRFELTDLPEGARIVGARVAPWLPAGGSDEAIVALVVQTASGHAYHYFHDALVADGGPPLLSDPIFVSEGEPFRIVELRVAGTTGDAIEITFRRGSFRSDESTSRVEERVFLDDCTLAPQIVVGKSRLVDVRSGEILLGR